MVPSHSGPRNCSKRWTNEAAGWFVGLSRRWCSLGKVSVTRAGVSGSVTWFRMALPEANLTKALEPFVAERLVSKGSDEAGQITAELAHEALI